VKLPFTFSFAIIAAILTILPACVPARPPVSETEHSVMSTSPPPAPVATNPLFETSTLPMRYPPFDLIRDEHFAEAFDRGMEQERIQVQWLVESMDYPSFENTIVALEKAGPILRNARQIFANLNSADTNEVRQELNQNYAPLFAMHRDAIIFYPGLFERIQKVYERRNMVGLDNESVRLIERYYHDFVRAGAHLDAAQKNRLTQINAALAMQTARFSDAVLAEINDSALVIDNVEELDGLSAAQIAAAADEAKRRDLAGKYVINLLNTTGQPLLTQLHHRPTRQRLFEASIARGSRQNEWNTTFIIEEVLRLRQERAQLLGYDNHAAYVLADETAGTVEAVNNLLQQLAPLAVANAKREAEALQALVDNSLPPFERFVLQPWDWAYYSEQWRKQQFNMDDGQFKPYFEIKNVLEKGVFFAANQLYGIQFQVNNTLPKYHPDIWVYDILDHDNTPLAIFIFDPYARPSKRGGAWMSAYVSQSHLHDTRAVIANHLNIPKPPAGEPTLLTWDEVITAFHEFGHALHGLFSDVKYPYFSGTRVPRDFVEFPSQVNEMWADWPQVMENYALHYQTGEPIPRHLVINKQESSAFNQGFATTEYLAAAVLDQYVHQLPAKDLPTTETMMDMEAQALAAAGLNYHLVPPRYRLPYFSHIMGGYAAGYYAYIWAEILDADVAQWFKFSGGLTRQNGDRFRRDVLSRGGSQEARDLFQAMIGREPNIEPLLARRGLNQSN